jgi:hypothetical protein
MEVLFCIYNKLRYNVGRLSVFGRLTTCRWQAKKKPLVTPILPDLSYARGRRCGLDYDLLSSIGQISLRLHRQHNSGERRWFSNKPIASYNLSLPRHIATSCRRSGRLAGGLALLRLLPIGYPQAWPPALGNKKSQVLAYPAFDNFLFQLHILLTVGCWRTLSAKPLNGEGEIVFPSSFVCWRNNSTGWWKCQKNVRWAKGTARRRRQKWEMRVRGRR